MRNPCSDTAPLLKNLALNIRERLQGQISLQSLPLVIQIDTSNRCPTLCIMCPRNSFQSTASDMHAEIISAISPALQCLCLADLGIEGEPLASPRFHGFLEALPRRASLYMTTSLQSLHDSHLSLLKLRQGIINVSLDAATENTYHFMRNGDFNSVLGNIKSIHSSTPLELWLSMTLSKINLPELPEFLLLAEKLAAKTVILRKLVPGFNFQIERDGLVFDYRKDQLDTQDLESLVQLLQKKRYAFRLIDYNNQRAFSPPFFRLKQVLRACSAKDSIGSLARAASYINPKRLICTRPWERLAISVNGDARICCSQKYPIGNFCKEDLADIWNGPVIRQMRSDFLANRFPEQCSGCMLHREKGFCF